MTPQAPRTYTLIIWGISFQILWFLTVELASAQRSQLAALINLIWVIALLYSRPKIQRVYLVRWGLAGLGIGALGDGLIINAGLYLSPQSLPVLSTPLWLLAMWITFSVFVPLSMDKVLTRPWIAVVFGGLGGPLSYLAGVRWGAMSFGGSPSSALFATGLFWSLVMYLATWVWKRAPLSSVEL